MEGDLDNITDDIDWRQRLPIAVLSFQSSGQIVESRVLGLVEVPMVVLTSVLHDIATDPALLGPATKNVKRNRGLLAFVGILVGAVAGGFISESTRQIQVPLWIFWGHHDVRYGRLGGLAGEEEKCGLMGRGHIVQKRLR